MAELVGMVILSAVSSAGVTGPMGATLAATTVFEVSLASVVGNVAIAAVSIGVSLALQPKPPKPSDGSQSRRLGISPRVGGYGRCRIGGTYALYETATDDRSCDVVALLSGRVSNFREFYLHDDAVTVVDGVVQPGLDGRYGGGALRLDWRYGEPAETAYAISTSLFPGLWTSAHRGDGVASLELACRSTSAEDFQKTYPSGLPEPSVVADLYALWDFRDPAQDPDDPATWVNYPAWSAGGTYALGARVLYAGVVYISAIASNTGNVPDARPDRWVSVWQNPVLQIVDYLTHPDHGMKHDRARIIDPVIDKLADEADLCDVQVMRKSGVTEPRYRSSGTFQFNTAPEGVFAGPLAACDGWMTESGDGTLALQVGVYRAPTVRIDYKHILGFGVNYGVPDETAINVMPIAYTSAGFKYRETPGEPWRDEAAISLAGIERPRDLDLLWVQSFSQARRLAKRAMHRENVPLRGHIVTDLYGLAALGERYITINYPFIAGLDEAVVEIQNAKVDFANGRVDLNWIKIDPVALEAWDPATDEGTAPTIPPEAQPTVIPVPQNPTLTVASGVHYMNFDAILDAAGEPRTDLGYVLNARRIQPGNLYGGWTSAVVDPASVTTTGGITKFPIPGATPVNGDEFAVSTRLASGTTGSRSTSVVVGIGAEAIALRNRMIPEPDYARVQAIDTCIKALQTAGTWAKLDALYMFAAHSEQASLLNWRADQFNATKVGAPVFTVDRGYAGFTGTAYINSNFTPASATPKVMTQDSAHLGVYSRENTAVNTGHDAGAAAGTVSLAIMARTTTNNIFGAVNNQTEANIGGTTSTDARGHFMIVRESSAALRSYRNGVNQGSAAQTSTGLVASRALLFGAKNLTTPLASGRALGGGHFGATMNTTEATATYNAIQAYMTAVGANV